MQRLNSVQGIVVEINFLSDNTITINFIWSIYLWAQFIVSDTTKFLTTEALSWLSSN